MFFSQLLPCQQSTHVAGSFKCPQVKAKMEVQVFARTHNISSREAAARLKTAHPAPGTLPLDTPPLRYDSPVPSTSVDSGLRKLEERLLLLESNVSSLRADVTPVIEAHAEIINLKTSLEEQNAPHDH